MPYSGKPSEGCTNCRKAKKKCDGGLPACARCVRLGKACGGYRDPLVFKPWRGPGESSKRKSPSESISPDITRQPSISKETVGLQFFMDQFVVESHLSFLYGISPDDFLMKPIVACGLACIANRNGDEREREVARNYYVQAIEATNQALAHPRRVKEDNTLVSIYLLSLFERISWLPRTSHTSWMNHTDGSARVLELRGRNQVRTKAGAAIFREVRTNVLISCLIREIESPEFLITWTQALAEDPYGSPSDTLAVLTARSAAIRAAYINRTRSDEELVMLCEDLEADLLAWSETTLNSGSVVSFYNMQDLDLPSAWDGSRHENGVPPGHRHWHLWRCVRIVQSRTHEAIWRRSWPTLSLTSQHVPDPAQHRSMRNRMVADICIALAYAFGGDLSLEPTKGSVSAACLLCWPLAMAGTCLLEQLVEPVSSPGGARILLLDRPRHTDPYNPNSMQLAWLIARADYITEKIGFRWAQNASRFLKGESNACLDVGRTKILKSDKLENLPESQSLSSSAAQLTLPESMDLSSPGASSESDAAQTGGSQP